MPDSPMKAKCFSEEDKRLMVERVRANETGIQNKVYKAYQLLEALTDPIVWCYVLLQISSTLIIGGLGVFSNIIISSFGFTVLQTQLLNIAQGGVTIAVMVGGAWLAQWTKQTAWIMHAWTMYVQLPQLIFCFCAQSSICRCLFDTEKDPLSLAPSSFLKSSRLRIRESDF